MVRVFIFFLFLLPPHAAHAAVYISEIAWMGSSASANDEWIELHNDGAAEDVTGWALVDDDALSIEFTGVIASGDYAVLERTDDASAPGTAFLIYTGALGNDGATLTLLREDGSIADQVFGGEGWEAVGGDNMSKETAQLTDAGWSTAPRTPGAVNVIGAPEDEKENDETDMGTETAVSKSTKGEKERVRISLREPDTELRLSLPGAVTTYVGQPVSLSPEARGIGETLIESLTYTWNFGDGTLRTGKQPVHQFAFPGTYVVVVEAEFARHSTVARTEVTVLPYNLSLSVGNHGEVRIHNDAAYEVDISKTTLSNGTDTFSIPEHTILMEKGTLTLKKRTLDFATLGRLALIDRMGSRIATYGITTNEEEITKPNKNIQTSAVRTYEPIESKIPETTKTETGNTTIEQEKATTTAATTLLPIAAVDGAPLPENGSSKKESRFPLYGLAAILGLSILSLYSVRIDG